MSTFEDLWAEYQPVVDSAASRFAATAQRWGADAADFRQEAVCWMLENERWLVARKEEIADVNEFGKFLRRCLTNEFKDYALDIRDQAGGQPRREAYWYTVAELEALLPRVFNEDEWHHPPQLEGETRSGGDPAIGGNWIATLADVSRAFDQLGAEDREILHAFHRDGWRNKDLAGYYKISESLMSYRHDRAVKRLLRILGDEKPRHMRPHDEYDPWRGRHAVSNAHARAITSSYYDE